MAVPILHQLVTSRHPMIHQTFHAWHGAGSPSSTVALVSQGVFKLPPPSGRDWPEEECSVWKHQKSLYNCTWDWILTSRCFPTDTSGLTASGAHALLDFANSCPLAWGPCNRVVEGDRGDFLCFFFGSYFSTCLGTCFFHGLSWSIHFCSKGCPLT